MARPIKRLQAEPKVMAELRRRSRSTTIGMRDRERANIILLRIEGLGVEAVAERLSTTLEARLHVVHSLCQVGPGRACR